MRWLFIVLVLAATVCFGFQSQAAEPSTNLLEQSSAKRKEELVAFFRFALRDPERVRVMRIEKDTGIEICRVHNIRLTPGKPFFMSPYRPRHPEYPHNGMVVVGCTGPDPDIPTVPVCVACVNAYKTAYDRELKAARRGSFSQS